jgi:hypothetical protein
LIFHLEANAKKSPKPQTSPVLRGQIINNEALPIPGATILVDGTTKGTASDLNGFFELDLSLITDKKITLVIGYVGAETKKIEVKTAELPIDLGKITLEKEE